MMDMQKIREALEPLASLSKCREPAFYDCPEDLVLYDDNMGNCITVGDVRCARNVIASLDGHAPAPYGTDPTWEGPGAGDD